MCKELEAKSGALLVWQDMTKLGKISGKELDTAANVMSLALRMRPAASAGFITCPVLISAQASTLRDEMRRFEDKLDAKGLANHLISLRMEIPPTSKKVPITFYGWLVMDGTAESSNVFSGSQLSYSEFQETAQYLSGFSFPEAILTALLGKTKLPSKVLGIVNCTPYDCWLERASMQCLGTNLMILLNFVEHNSFAKIQEVATNEMMQLFLGHNPAFQNVSALCQCYMLQAWKNGTHNMGNVRPYDPNPVELPDDVKLSDFSFKLVSVEIGDPKKKSFNEKYKVKLPASIRSRYSDDVIFGSDWRELLKDFDSKFGTGGQMRPVLAPAATPVEPELPPWTGEPTNITQLQDRYLVEGKITGRLAGTTLFVVMAKDRSGKVDTCK
eukprot:s1099_g8.t1